MTNEQPPRRLRTEYADEPAGIEVDRPRFGWELPGAARQRRYRVRIATSREALAEDRADAWDSGAVASTRSTGVEYGGEALTPGTRYYWQVRVDAGEGFGPWSEVATFETGIPESRWAAEWIARATEEELAPAPLLRRAVDLDGAVERARAYVAAAGYYELHVDGERIGNAVLDTGRTDYEERVLYATHDLTDALGAGENAIGLELGRDWYALTSENVWGWERAPWRRDQPAVCLQVEIEFADGSTRTIGTDESWRTTDGPTRYDSVYCGEMYDAREAVPGWDEAGFDDADWEAASPVEGPAGPRAAQIIEPMRVVDRLDPVAIEEPEPETYVFDFGEVTAGRVELTVDGPEGTEIDLVHGEKRHDDGTVDVEQRHVDCDGRGDIQTDTYVLAGDGKERWASRFSYKGFQYVEVRGFPGEPTPEALTAEVIHTPIEDGSRSGFRCSNDLLTRIHENSRRAFLNNCHGVPTDTPVFEKNGWTGDAQVGAEMALFNFDLDRFFTKWLDDFADAQRPDGEIPPIVPTSDWGYSDRPMDGGINSPNPGWDVAYPLIAWWTYRYCGDRRLLEAHYEGMKGVVDWTGTYAEDGIVREGLGDWLAPSHEESQQGIPPEGPAIVATAFYHRMARTIADVAGVLGHEEDRETYAALADEIEDAFNDAFLDREAGVYATGEVGEYRQTSNLFPLAFDLVPEDCRDAVVENLIEDVADTHDGHLNTGFHGTKYLLPVLTDHGYLDLAYEVATQTTYPSWGYWIEAHDATAIYEAWELSARSRDHFAFGAAIDEWFYKYLAGIEPAEPGFDRVEIVPHVPTDLDSVAADVDTVHGVVSVDWEQGEAFELRVSVPSPEGATVRVPVFEDTVGIDGKSIEAVDGAEIRERTGDRVVVDVAAGDWTFTS